MPNKISAFSHLLSIAFVLLIHTGCVTYSDWEVKRLPRKASELASESSRQKEFDAYAIDRIGGALNTESPDYVQLKKDDGGRYYRLYEAAPLIREVSPRTKKGFEGMHHANVALGASVAVAFAGIFLQSSDHAETRQAGNILFIAGLTGELMSGFWRQSMRESIRDDYNADLGKRVLWDQRSSSHPSGKRKSYELAVSMPFHFK